MRYVLSLTEREIETILRACMLSAIEGEGCPGPETLLRIRSQLPAGAAKDAATEILRLEFGMELT